MRADIVKQFATIRPNAPRYACSVIEQITLKIELKSKNKFAEDSSDGVITACVYASNIPLVARKNTITAKPPSVDAAPSVSAQRRP